MRQDVFKSMSRKLSETLHHKGLLDEADVPFLQYRTEGILEELFFWFVILGIAKPFKIRKQVAIYTAATLLYRKNMGGWHARSAKDCQVLSVVTVISVVLFADRYNLSKLIGTKGNLICVVTAIIGLLVPLNKAEELQLDEKDIAICVRHKTVTIVFMTALEVLAYKTDNAFAATYMLLGLLTTLVSIGISCIS